MSSRNIVHFVMLPPTSVEKLAKAKKSADDSVKVCLPSVNEKLMILVVRSALFRLAASGIATSKEPETDIVNW